MNGSPWFVRRRFGFGWTPVTWQGWAVTLGYVAAVAGLAYGIAEAEPYLFWTLLVVLTGLFALVCYLTGRG